MALKADLALLATSAPTWAPAVSPVVVLRTVLAIDAIFASSWFKSRVNLFLK